MAANPKIKNPDRIAIGRRDHDPGARDATPGGEVPLGASRRPVCAVGARPRLSARTASG